MISAKRCGESGDASAKCIEDIDSDASPSVAGHRSLLIGVA
jgi:hypothetical protein